MVQSRKEQSELHCFHPFCKCTPGKSSNSILIMLVPRRGLESGGFCPRRTFVFPLKITRSISMQGRKSDIASCEIL